MTDQYIQIPLDATGNSSGASGKKIDTSQVNTSSGLVQRQRVTIGDPNAAEQFALVSPPGALYAATDASELFDDTFVSLDTTNRWNTPVSSGGGVAAAVVAGNGYVTLGTGTTANGYSYITSQFSFNQTAPGWLQLQHAINLESPITANTYRFWGFGNPITSSAPTAAAPLLDAIGFEVATSGKMYAVCYASGLTTFGTRSVIQDLSSATGNSTQPTDANAHKYLLYFRGDLAYWAIDNYYNVVATMLTGTPGPVNNILPICLMAIAGSSAPSSSGVITNDSCWLGDTTGQPIQIADGTYQWRKAQVDSEGNLHVGNIPYQTVTTGTTWAAATSSGTTQVIDNTGSGPTPYGYLVQLDQGAGISAGAITFQVTGDGTNWVTIPASLVFDPTTYLPISLPYSLVASTNRAFLIVLCGYQGLRLECSTTTAGGSVTPYWSTVIDIPGILNTAGVYNSALPTLTSGQSAAIQLDSKGQQYVDLNYIAGTALGTPTNFGTTPGTGSVSASANASLFIGTTALATNIAGVPKVDLSYLAGSALGAPSVFGTTPTAVNATSANVSLFVGTTVVSTAGAGLIAVVGAPSAMSGVALSLFSVELSAASTVVKAAAGNLYGLSIYNNSTAALFLQLFNTTTTTSLATSSYICSFGIGNSASLTIPPGAVGLKNFGTGIVILVATGSTSTTTAAGASISGAVFYL